MPLLSAATTRGTTAPWNWYSWPRSNHRCLFYLVKMMMMIIVRILFNNLEGCVITSPAIPDKSLIIFLKTENTADGFVIQGNWLTSRTPITIPCSTR